MTSSTTDRDGAAMDADSTSEGHLREARERADRYLAELIEEVGEPSPVAVTRAEAMWSRVELARKAPRAAG